jgi:phage terminase small subunit
MTDEVKKPYINLEDAQVLAYVNRYIQTWNKTEAYLAVHPESSRPSAMSNTYKYWKNPTVQATIRVIMDDLGMGNDEILATITAIARGDDKTNKANQLKALELLGKMKGMFMDRLDITTAGEKVSWQQIISREGSGITSDNIMVVDR